MSFLSAKSGLNSGFMIAQGLPQHWWRKRRWSTLHPQIAFHLCQPEDHVSMGTIAARRARQILEHAEWVLSIELMCAAQALDLRRPLRKQAIESIHEEVRTSFRC